MPFRVMGRLGLDSVGISRTTGAPHWRMCLHCDGSSAMQHSHWWQGFGRNRSRPSTPMSVNWKLPPEPWTVPACGSLRLTLATELQVREEKDS